MLMAYFGATLIEIGCRLFETGFPNGKEELYKVFQDGRREALRKRAEEAEARRRNARREHDV